MKEYVFPYSARFGKLDSVDSEIEVSISNKDASKLERSAKEGDKYNLMDEPELGHVFDKVYSAILKHETIVQEELGELSKIEIEDYLDAIDFKIYYPKELQLLEMTIEPKVKKYEVIVTDRESACELKNTGPNNVIYVDDGECLFYIPLKYTGKFTFKEGTKCFEKDVFKMHKNITEIEVCEGIDEIPEECFEQCEKLKSISVPGSVKDIGFNAFTKCYRLCNVNLSEGIEFIHHCAFRYCEGLNELVIPSTVKEINNWIAYCMTSNIEKIYISGMSTVVTGNNKDDCIWYVHEGSEAEKNVVENEMKYMLF